MFVVGNINAKILEPFLLHYQKLYYSKLSTRRTTHAVERLFSKLNLHIH